MCGIIFRGPWVVDGIHRTKKKRFGLVAEPFTTDFSLDFSAHLLLEHHRSSLGFEVSGEVFTILEVYSVFHFVSFPFLFCVFIITEERAFVKPFPEFLLLFCNNRNRENHSHRDSGGSGFCLRFQTLSDRRPTDTRKS